ncbi:MAG: TonB-dependent receptor [Pseudomonadota bacterium]
MRNMFLAGAAALAIAPASAAAQSTLDDTAMAARDTAVSTWVDVITVTGRPISADTELEAEYAPAIAPDAAGLAARLPGAALIDNGALSGQVQYRGLFGPRVAIRVNGQRFGSGGPNMMDPPLHYAPAPLLERIELSRGPAPVSSGPAIGAALNAVFKSIDFAPTGAFETRADLTAIARSVDESFAVGGVAGIANDRHRVQLSFAEESGGDVETPFGALVGTEHERTTWGVLYGVRLGEGSTLTLSTRGHEVDDTGNPPFPLDIRYMDAFHSMARLDTDVSQWALAFTLGHARIDHAMNNINLRPSPPAMRVRETLASGETVTFELSAERRFGTGLIRIGGDHERNRHDVTITNPLNTDFFVTPFPDIELTRLGAFAEWDGSTGLGDLYLGARVDAHEAEAGIPKLGPALPMGPRMLAANFEAADRSWDDVTVDAMARLSRRVSDAMVLRAALSRKSRVGGYLQRFGWLPISASGGLADGNTYVGSLQLDPEVATSFEAGFDYAASGVYARVTGYASHIDDYIQGAPAEPVTFGVIDTPLEMISSMNGDATPLRFSNTEARLYGIDGEFGVDLPGAWRIDGVLSLVRGEREDIDADLYRIAPSSLRVSLAYEAARWSGGVETLAVAEQDRVSAINNETATPGHVLINLFARAELNDAVRVSAGVENLLDHRYREHLSGFNRNSGLGVDLGERIPGPGAGVWLRLDTAF